MKHFHSSQRLEKELILVSLIVVIGHILGSSLRLYNKLFFLDIIVHFFGGAWLVFVGFAFIPFFKRETNKTKFVLSLAVVALFGGILWEIFEFSLDQYSLSSFGFVPGFQGPPLDTLSDLFFDTVGGLLAAFYIKSRD